jgi:hypothetical protein
VNRLFRHTWLRGGLLALSLASQLSAANNTYTAWTGGSGIWTDGTKWSSGLPDDLKEAAVLGQSTVVIPSGEYAAALLEVGANPGDRARVEVDGGQLLLRQDSLRIGEYTGSEGTLVLKGGSVDSVMDVFVGAVTGSTGRMTKASLIIQGGSLVGLNLTVGEGLGADSRLEIDGSRASAVEALEFCYLLGTADPGGKPGVATLAF